MAYKTYYQRTHPDAAADTKSGVDWGKKAKSDAAYEKQSDKDYEDASEKAFKAKRAAKSGTASRSTARKRSVPAPVVGEKLAGMRASPPKGKIDLPEEKADTSAFKSKSTVKQAHQPTVERASAPAKKRGKARRAISAVGRGFKKAFGGGGGGKTALAKNKGGGGKSGYEGKWV